MQESSIASSSVSPTSFLLRERDSGKLSPDHLTATSGELRAMSEIDQPSSQSTTCQRMFTSFSQWVAFRHPRAYSSAKQIILYVRGPRPKEDLSCMLFPLCLSSIWTLSCSNKPSARQEISPLWSLYIPFLRVYSTQIHSSFLYTLAVRCPCRGLHHWLCVFRTGAIFLHSRWLIRWLYFNLLACQRRVWVGWGRMWTFSRW